MHIVRFRAGDEARHGVIEGSHIVEYTGTPYGTFRKARKKYPLKQSVLLAPVVPSKVVAVGLNYRDHAEEQNLPVPSEPIIFLKPLSALSGPDDPIVFPPQAKRVDYEAELAIVIKKRCRHVAPERAREHVLGYTCLNDVTARDLQARDGQWTRAKGFDSFCPIGPCIVTDIDPNGVDIETYLNGERKQSSNTKLLHLPHRGRDRADLRGDDPPAGRRDRHGHARRGRADAARGQGGGAHRGDREPEEPGDQSDI